MVEFRSALQEGKMEAGSGECRSASSSLLRHRTLRRSSTGGSKQKRHRSMVSPPRMVDRDLPFHQSRNKMNVSNSDPKHYLWKLQMIDWFHTMLRLPALLSVGILLLLWLLLVFGFAVLFWYLDNVHYNFDDCGLGTTDNSSISLSGSIAFSMETWTTVGYGLPGTSTSFFEKGCSFVQGTIYLEMVWSMMFNAFLFAFFFSLLSKSEFRSTQIVFTNKLLVNVDKITDTNPKHHRLNSTCLRGGPKKPKAYVRLQCYDIDSAHPLVEAHARMYFLDHKLKMHPLRLMDPNDDLGGALYPSVPTDIVHHIDHHSALCPPNHRPPHVLSSHGLVLRSLDGYTGNRDEIVCPVCGESYGTYEQWKLHVKYSAMIEAREGYPPEDCHISLAESMPEDPKPITLEELRDHIEKTLSEIIVVVEAIDPQLSGTFQSLQSYKYEDIVFGEEFGECMSTKLNYRNLETHHGKQTFCVDMNQFHSTTMNKVDLNKHNSDFHSKTPKADRRTSSMPLTNTKLSFGPFEIRRPSVFFSSPNFDSFFSEVTDSGRTVDFVDKDNNNEKGDIDDDEDNKSDEEDIDDDNDDDGDDDDDDDDGSQIEPGVNYFARSYDTFNSIRSGFRDIDGETNIYDTQRNWEDGGNGIARSDRMPAYASIV